MAASRFEYREAVKDRTSEKRLDHIRIIPGEEGGHTVEHHYSHDGLVFHKPQTHVFGKDEGVALLHHIVEHAGISVEPPETMKDED